MTDTQTDLRVASVEGVRKSFRTRSSETVRAVDGVDLTIERGEVVALLGPNGAGKTTLLDMLLGLTTPDTGSIRLLGQSPRDAVRAGLVSAVLQTGGLLRDLTVAETVRMIASTYAEHRPLDDVLERAGLTAKSGRMVSKCSGGEQQRLKFALALLPDPELIVLDEPTTGMDVSARRDFWAAMHAEADAGRTVLFATHYLAEADAFADRIVVMSAGRVIADGSTHEIRHTATSRTVSARVADGRTDSVTGLLRVHEHVTDVTVEDDRVVVRASDSDAIARLLLDHPDTDDLTITQADLEDAFVSLTTAHENGATA